MDNAAIVEEIVRNLAFEVEAVPDNVVEVTGTSRATPLNIKIRVRKKDESLNQLGALALRKVPKPNTKAQKIRVVNSDHTIMSFNLVMEDAESEKPMKNPHKPFLRNICLGSDTSSTNFPYVPSSAYKDAEGSIGSQSDRALKTQYPSSKVHSLKGSPDRGKRNKDIFGTCKPGGCLDPPFGEDTHPYESAKPPPLGHETKSRKSSSIFSNKLFKKKKKSDKLSKNATDNSDAMIEKQDSVQTATIYSNSILTYPSPMNEHDKQPPEKRLSRNIEESSFYIPPKKDRKKIDSVDHSIEIESISNTVEIQNKSFISDQNFTPIEIKINDKNSQESINMSKEISIEIEYLKQKLTEEQNSQKGTINDEVDFQAQLIEYKPEKSEIVPSVSNQNIISLQDITKCNHKDSYESPQDNIKEIYSFRQKEKDAINKNQEFPEKENEEVNNDKNSIENIPVSDVVLQKNSEQKLQPLALPNLDQILSHNKEPEDAKVEAGYSMQQTLHVPQTLVWEQSEKKSEENRNKMYQDTIENNIKEILAKSNDELQEVYKFTEQDRNESTKYKGSEYSLQLELSDISNNILAEKTSETKDSQTEKLTTDGILEIESLAKSGEQLQNDRCFDGEGLGETRQGKYEDLQYSVPQTLTLKHSKIEDSMNSKCQAQNIIKDNYAMTCEETQFHLPQTVSLKQSGLQDVRTESIAKNQNQNKEYEIQVNNEIKHDSKSLEEFQKEYSYDATCDNVEEFKIKYKENDCQSFYEVGYSPTIIRPISLEELETFTQCKEQLEHSNAVVDSINVEQRESLHSKQESQVLRQSITSKLSTEECSTTLQYEKLSENFYIPTKNEVLSLCNIKTEEETLKIFVEDQIQKEESSFSEESDNIKQIEVLSQQNTEIKLDTNYSDKTSEPSEKSLATDKNDITSCISNDQKTYTQEERDLNIESITISNEKQINEQFSSKVYSKIEQRKSYDTNKSLTKEYDSTVEQNIDPTKILKDKSNVTRKLEPEKNSQDSDLHKAKDFIQNNLKENPLKSVDTDDVSNDNELQLSNRISIDSDLTSRKSFGLNQSKPDSLIDAVNDVPQTPHIISSKCIIESVPSENSLKKGKTADENDFNEKINISDIRVDTDHIDNNRTEPDFKPSDIINKDIKYTYSQLRKPSNLACEDIKEYTAPNQPLKLSSSHFPEISKPVRSKTNIENLLIDVDDKSITQEGDSISDKEKQNYKEISSSQGNDDKLVSPQTFDGIEYDSTSSLDESGTYEMSEDIKSDSIVSSKNNLEQTIQQYGKEIIQDTGSDIKTLKSSNSQNKSHEITLDTEPASIKSQNSIDDLSQQDRTSSKLSVHDKSSSSGGSMSLEADTKKIAQEFLINRTTHEIITNRDFYNDENINDKISADYSSIASEKSLSNNKGKTNVIPETKPSELSQSTLKEIDSGNDSVQSHDTSSSKNLISNKPPSIKEFTEDQRHSFSNEINETLTSKIESSTESTKAKELSDSHTDKIDLPVNLKDEENLYQVSKASSPASLLSDKKIYKTNNDSILQQEKSLSPLDDKSNLEGNIKAEILSNQFKECESTVNIKHETSVEINLQEYEERMKTVDQTTVQTQESPKKDIPIIIDFGFRSYVNKNNERIIKTFDGNLSNRYSNETIFVAKCDIREPFEMRIPTDAENYLFVKLENRKLQPKSELNIDKTMDTNSKPKCLIKEVGTSEETMYKKAFLDRGEINVNHQDKPIETVNEDIKIALTELYRTYENDLIPLQETITELKKDVEFLTKQQMIYKETLIMNKKIRRIRSVNMKKCGCVKNVKLY